MKVIQPQDQKSTQKKRLKTWKNIFYFFHIFYYWFSRALEVLSYGCFLFKMPFPTNNIWEERSYTRLFIHLVFFCEALRSIGKGCSAARKFSASLYLTPPSHQQHWSSYSDRLDQKSQLLVKIITQNVCQELLHDHKNQDDIVIVATSFDCSWGIRG